jgi:hypothetical protein
MKRSRRHEENGSVGERCRRPTHREDGVDVTLIRWMLSLTPAQRLEVLQHAVWSIRELRAGLPKT